MSKKCSTCQKPVTLKNVATFCYDAHRSMKKCLPGDTIFGWVDENDMNMGCQNNENMAHSVNGLINEVRRNGLVVGRKRRG